MTLRTAGGCPPISLPSTRRRRVSKSGPRNTWFHAELRSVFGENAPGDGTGGVFFGHRDGRRPAPEVTGGDGEFTNEYRERSGVCGLLVVLAVVAAIAGFTRGALRALVRSRLRGPLGGRHCRILRRGQQPRARYEQRYDEHTVNPECGREAGGDCQPGGLRLREAKHSGRGRLAHRSERGYRLRG